MVGRSTSGHRHGAHRCGTPVRDRFAPGTAALYTLGGGPDGGFPRWLARSGADTLAAWREFVHEVATRFDGRIRYWEVWNEPDSHRFYLGSAEQLVALTRVAADELRAVNPRNIVISPSFTQYGLGMMERFLAAGGGRYADIIGWHQDNSATPEADTAVIANVHALMRKYGVADLPLWTTEGHAHLDPGGDPAATLARTYLVLWATA